MFIKSTLPLDAKKKKMLLCVVIRHLNGGPDDKRNFRFFFFFSGIKLLDLLEAVILKKGRR